MVHNCVAMQSEDPLETKFPYNNVQFSYSYYKNSWGISTKYTQLYRKVTKYRIGLIEVFVLQGKYKYFGAIFSFGSSKAPELPSGFAGSQK